MIDQATALACGSGSRLSTDSDTASAVNDERTISAREANRDNHRRTVDGGRPNLAANPSKIT